MTMTESALKGAQPASLDSTTPNRQNAAHARPPVPRLLLRVDEACEALGCGYDWFARHVTPEVRWVQRGGGRHKLVSIRELERWVERNSAILLRDEVDD